MTLLCMLCHFVTHSQLNANTPDCVCSFTSIPGTVSDFLIMFRRTFKSRKMRKGGKKERSLACIVE